MKTLKQFTLEVYDVQGLNKKDQGWKKFILPNGGEETRASLFDHMGEHIGTHLGHHIYKFEHPLQKSVTYAAINPKTGKATLAVRGDVNRAKVLSHLHLASSDDNTFPAHELYHHLLKHGHVAALVADEQSPGGRKVWEKLAKKKDVNIHGWDPTYRKPVNIKVGEDDTHEESPPAQISGQRYRDKYRANNPDSSVPRMQLVAHMKD